MAVVVVAAVSDRGESMAGLLEHCDRREAVLATDIKYTQTQGYAIFSFLPHCIYVLIRPKYFCLSISPKYPICYAVGKEK